MKFRYILSFVIFVTMAASCGHRRNDESEIAEPELPRLGFYSDSLIVEEWTVRSGENFISMFSHLGMSGDDAYALSQACDSVFDVRKLRAGNTFSAYYDSLGHDLKYVVYDNDKIHQTVFRCFPPFSAWASEKEVVRERKYADVTIRSSLWNDMLASGSSPLLILKLSDIYAWTVDFFGLQENDRFRMVYGQTLCEDEVISVDTVYYSVFTRDGKDLCALMFDQGDGGNIYWNEKGESMRRAFLKAPLQFSRISSGFSYHRKHPITGKVKPHTAVDYAAPYGTPVMSIGDGTVLSVGWAGGGGNTIKIRHGSAYVTSYMHLSKYAKGLKAGQHVHQGQVIGYVGSTGSSTGPHLDFRVYHNGTPVNPLKMESPSEDPIRRENLPALDSLKNVYEAVMKSMSSSE